MTPTLLLKDTIYQFLQCSFLTRTGRTGKFNHSQPRRTECLLMIQTKLLSLQGMKGRLQPHCFCSLSVLSSDSSTEFTTVERLIQAEQPALIWLKLSKYVQVAPGFPWKNLPSRTGTVFQRSLGFPSPGHRKCDVCAPVPHLSPGVLSTSQGGSSRFLSTAHLKSCVCPSF